MGGFFSRRLEDLPTNGYQQLRETCGQCLKILRSLPSLIILCLRTSVASIPRGLCRRSTEVTLKQNMIRLKENLRKVQFWRSVMGEFFGVMFLVVIGCGASMDDDGSTPNSHVMRIAIAFGLTYGTVLYCFQRTLDGNMNTAVTLAMAVTRRISLMRCILYIIAQLLGAVLGASILYWATLTGDTAQYFCTFVDGRISEGRGFFIEFFGTFILVFVVFASSEKAAKESRLVAPFITGVSFISLSLFTIPYTGGSMNTARSFGPALVQGEWKSQWVYWFGPLMGGMAGGTVYDLVFSVTASCKRVKSCLLVFNKRDDSYEVEQRMSRMRAPKRSNSDICGMERMVVETEMSRTPRSDPQRCSGKLYHNAYTGMKRGTLSDDMLSRHSGSSKNRESRDDLSRAELRSDLSRADVRSVASEGRIADEMTTLRRNSSYLESVGRSTRSRRSTDDVSTHSKPNSARMGEERIEVLYVDPGEQITANTDDDSPLGGAIPSDTSSTPSPTNRVQKVNCD